METVKGFRDFTGEEAEKREKVRAVLVENFEKYGFEPAETPVVEYREFVKGENSNDEAVSDIFKLEDKGKRELALRYEFTFQLKRLMTGKKIPYKRYEIGPVFRDEPVSGNRLRQFVQCDADIVGSTIKDEAEILSIAIRVLSSLGIRFKIYINNRKLLNEILEKENVKPAEREKVIKEIDKLDKLSEEEVYNNLKQYKAQNLLKLFKQPESYFKKYEFYADVKELKEMCRLYGVEVSFSPSLARGLSYYNGNVFEVKSNIKETITAGGSFMFNNIQCTGISFGLDRLSLLAKMKSFRKKVMVLSIGQDREAVRVSEFLRDKGVLCITSYAKIGKAMEYANSAGIGYTVFVGEDEVKKGLFKVRDMKSGREKMVNVEKIADLII